MTGGPGKPLFTGCSALLRQSRLMRSFLLGLCLLGFAASSALSADEKAHPQVECLSSGDALEAVSTRQVVEPAKAMTLARNAAPGGEIVRASLCRDAGALVYLVLALKKDGRLVRVTIDATAGKVKTIH
jgi:uncharacterized membrane protein YkoI